MTASGRRIRISAIVGAVIMVTASALGVLYATVFRDATELTAEPGNENVVVLGESDEVVQGVLEDAEDAVGFEVLVPHHLPTEASRLVLVDSRVQPEGGPFRRVELIFDSGKGAEQNSGASTLEFFQMPFRIESPEGEPWSEHIDGWDMHRAEIHVGETGEPDLVTYTARDEDSTYIMTFAGEQPTPEGLAMMLASLSPVS